MNRPLALVLAAVALALVAADRPSSVTLTYPDGSTVVYVPGGVLTPVPTTPPVPVPATLPTTDPNVVLVAPGQSWVAAVRAARPGQTVRLPAGEVREPLTDTTVRPAAGVTIDGTGTTLRVPKGPAVVAWCWERVTIKGLRVVADDPADQAGVRLYQARGVTLDGCAVTGFAKGLTTEAAGDGPAQRGDGVRLLNCDFSGNSARGGTYPDRTGKPQRVVSAGVYASRTDRLEVRGCRFADCGWLAGVFAGTEFNHALYLAGDCGPARVVGNVFARPSSHGLQLRCGGDATDNLFVDCPIGLSFALVNGEGPLPVGGCSGTVARNLFVGTRLLAGSPRGWAIEVGDNVLSATVTGNEVLIPVAAAPPTRGQAVAAIKVDVGALSEKNPFKGKGLRAVRDLTVSDNAVTHFAGPLWVHKDVAAKAKLRSAGTRLVTQTEWPAADPNVEAAARARAR